MANDLKHPIKRVADICDFIRAERATWEENQDLTRELRDSLEKQLGTYLPLQQGLPDLYLLVESLCSRAAEEEG